jgi:transposase-like protein
MTHRNKSALTTLIGELSEPAGDRVDTGEAMRRLLEAALQDLVDAQADAHIGAGRYERSETRKTHRNGSRPKTLDTRAGTVELAIPKLREGSFFPSLLEPRRRVDQALWAVIGQAWVSGVSTRRVDALVKALGNESGISKSQVSRVCAQIDECVAEFLGRDLATTWYPYLWLDATYVPVRLGARVASQAVVVATGCSIEGKREVLGMAVGDSESTDFWTEFLRSLRQRGLKTATPQDPTGVALVVSDAHDGLTNAVRAVLPGASWQRCRVHFARNVTSKLGPARSKPVNALIGTVYAQTTPEAVKDAYHQVAASLEAPFPEIAAMLHKAEPDLTAFAAMPYEHWRKIWSNNPIERLNREIKRRADVVQIFPDRASVTRLIGAILLEQHDEWQHGERRYLSDTSMRRLVHTLHQDTKPSGAVSTAETRLLAA